MQVYVVLGLGLGDDEDAYEVVNVYRNEDAAYAFVQQANAKAEDEDDELEEATAYIVQAFELDESTADDIL